MGIYIDFHAHILPEADHGSDSLETSLFQLQAASEAGVGLIAATPHFYPDTDGSKRFFQVRDRAYEKLAAAYRGDVRILPGAEVFLCEGLQNHPGLPGLCIGGTRTILIEMPEPPWSGRLVETLSAIQDAGYEIILAHIDRYPAADALGLIRSGFRWQINAEGVGRLRLRRKLPRWIEDGAVCALGSDIHGRSDAYGRYAGAVDMLGARGTLLQESMRRLLLGDG